MLDFLQDTEEVSPEEQQVRLKKADSIRKMLAEQSTPTTNKRSGKWLELKTFRVQIGPTSFYDSIFPIFTENLDEEKKEREHLLALNQVIAQQVLQKRRSLPGSKICKKWAWKLKYNY